MAAVSPRLFQSALLRQGLSVPVYAREIGRSEQTVYGWLKNGVPDRYVKSLGGLKSFIDQLNTSEHNEYGASHGDLFDQRRGLY